MGSNRFTSGWGGAQVGKVLSAPNVRRLSVAREWPNGMRGEDVPAVHTHRDGTDAWTQVYEGVGGLTASMQRPDTEATGRPTRPTGPTAGRGAPKRRRPVAPPRRGLVRRLSRLLLLVLFVGVLTGGLAYVRLLYGPISLHILAAPIASGLGEELGGLTTTIADVQVRLTDGGGLEFGLSGVDVRDTDGGPLVSAPWAAVTLSPRAALTLRIAPETIALVAPRLHLYYADDGTLSLHFQTAADPADSEAPASARGDAAKPPAAVGSSAASAPVSAVRRIDLVKTLAAASARARRREAASSYLREIGLRDARVVVEHAARKSIWNVPEVRIDLDHRKSRTSITGAATIASLTGPWTIAFKTYEHASAEQLELQVNLAGLVPHGLARMAPGLAVLEGLEVPISGEASLEVTRAGELRAGKMRLALGAGRIRTPWLGDASFALDRGALDATYSGDDGTFKISALQLAWQGSRLNLDGTIKHQARSASAPPTWHFDFASTDGQLAGPDGAAPTPVKVGALGRWAPDEGRATLTRFSLRAAGGEIQASGDAVDLTGTLRAHLDGRISPMPVAAFATLWPQALAPAARTWLNRHITKGQILGGTFRLATARSESEPQGAQGLPRVTLALEAAGVEANLVKGAPTLEVQRALVRLEGAALEVTAPDAALSLGDGKRVALKNARLTAVELNGEQPVAEFSVRATGALGTLAEMADREPFQLLRANGIVLTGLEGKADGQFKASFPVIGDLTLADVRFEGKARITDGKLRQVAGSYDIAGANFTIDATDKAVDVKGEMLVKGVLAKVAWQRIAGAAAERQPPLRVTATLDNSDRAQLGLDVNDIVQGEVPVEITVTREPGKTEPLVRVRADLTKSDMVIEPIAWAKPPGRAAAFQFDFVKGEKGRAELQNVKLVGDTIAVEGSMVIGADNKLREFHYPEFSVNVVSRLDVQGKLRADNVWEVHAKGPTYDGRDLFREIFSLDKVRREPPAKEKPGLDLTADIDTVIGFSDTSLKGVHIRAQRRNEKLVGLDFRGAHEGAKKGEGRQFAAVIQPEAGQARRLRAESWDAGQTFKLVGFYPNAVGGHMKLDVNLDAKGAADKTGLLWTENFAVLGDPVVSEVLQSGDTSQPAIGQGNKGRRRVVRQQFDFDELVAPFSIGYGQFVLDKAIIRGPVVGATVRGKVDFKQQTLNIGGTYVPLSGLNSAIGGIPIFGQLLAGPQGEGIFGITFAIQGPMGQPQVIVNPFALLTPGILREFQQITPYDPKVLVRDEKAVPKPKGDAARASSAPMIAPATPPGSTVAPAMRAPRTANPEVSGAWSSEIRVDQPKRN